MSETLDKLTSEFYEKAEALEGKLSAIQEEISKAETEAHARGFKEGLKAQSFDFDNKVIVVKVPEDQVEEVTRMLSRSDRLFKNCRFVILSDVTELKDLHELELKVLGLKKIE